MFKRLINRKKLNRKKVVCMLLDNPYVYDNRVRREAETLAQNGYEVHIFALEGVKYTNPALPREEIINQVYIHRRIKTKYFYYHQKLKNWRYFWTFFKEVKATCPKVDIVHVHDVLLLPYGSFIRWMTGARLIFDSHEYWDAWINYKIVQDKRSDSAMEKPSGQMKHPQNWQLVRKMQDWILPNCDAVISVSPSICNALQSKIDQSRKIEQSRKIDQPDQSVTLIRNIAIAPRAVSNENPKLFHKHFNLESETKILLYQGGIEPTRGIDRIIHAMQYLLDLPVVLILMGPIQSEQYMTLLRADAPANRFFYKEGVYSADYLQWTRSADVGIIATLNIHESFYYSLPNKLFEYIQAGIPILNPDFQDSAKLVTDYGIGLNFDMEEPANFAKAVRQLITSSELYTHFKSNMSAAGQTLCWEEEQKVLTNLYAKISP